MRNLKLALAQLVSARTVSIVGAALAVAGAMALGACSSDTGTTGGESDAGSAADTGGGTDSAGGTDSGGGADSSGSTDSGRGTDSGSGTDSGGTDASDGFGMVCTGNGNCPAAYPTCFNFNAKGMRCTKSCQSAADCPGGAGGLGCSGMNVCKIP